MGGVLSSLGAMKWVMVLTMLLLYACSIIFTSVVGKGLVSDGSPTDQEILVFGSTAKSLFSLFKLMNGDISVVMPICKTLAGKLMFITFMVVSNWAILAILTSVVSDKMILVSQREEEEEEEKAREKENEQRKKLLLNVFKRVDLDESGSISEEEWNNLLEDKDLCADLCDAANLQERDLRELFSCWLALTKSDTLEYEDFVEHLKEDGNIADKRTVMMVMTRLRELEMRVESRFDEVVLARHHSCLAGLQML